MVGKFIYIDDELTWPAELYNFLSSNLDALRDWEVQQTENKKQLSHERILQLVKAYDNVIKGLRKILDNYYLHGYHCTRLTELEIREIGSNGMSLPNVDSLSRRIRLLQNENTITSKVAELLLSDNQAGDGNRANMIWFCFFKPYIGGQLGIQRFFKSWGGEALYNSHERNPLTGTLLNGIGNPCVVEAKVPISKMEGPGLAIKIAKQFMINKGIANKERTDHEGYINSFLPAGYIMKIHKFPEYGFIELTKCNLWNYKLR